jgi:hypothetical protein
MQRARGLLSQFLRKFIHDGLPVALAGAIGTMLFGQLGRPSAPPPAPVMQQPASDATMELMREEHALVLDLLKRQAETTRVANSAQENALEAKQLAAAADERAARARASPAKAPPISAAKPIHHKEMAAGDPLPLTPPAPTAGNAAAPAVVDKPEPAGSSHVIGKLFGWASAVARLPGRLWGATERLIEDVPGTTLPPLGLPGRQLRAAM